MCPQCDVCPYWNLSDACVYTKMAYLFDHPGTVFYSVFTAFWGTFVTLCSFGLEGGFCPSRCRGQSFPRGVGTSWILDVQATFSKLSGISPHEIGLGLRDRVSKVALG